MEDKAPFYKHPLAIVIGIIAIFGAGFTAGHWTDVWKNSKKDFVTTKSHDSQIKKLEDNIYQLEEELAKLKEDCKGKTIIGVDNSCKILYRELEKMKSTLKLIKNRKSNIYENEAALDITNQNIYLIESILDQNECN